MVGSIRPPIKIVWPSASHLLVVTGLYSLQLEFLLICIYLAKLALRLIVCLTRGYWCHEKYFVTVLDIAILFLGNFDLPG